MDWNAFTVSAGFLKAFLLNSRSGTQWRDWKVAPGSEARSDAWGDWVWISYPGRESVPQCPFPSPCECRSVGRTKQHTAAITEGVRVIKHLSLHGSYCPPGYWAAAQRERQEVALAEGGCFLLLRMDKWTGWRLFLHGSCGGKEQLKRGFKLEEEVTYSQVLISDAKETKNSQAALRPRGN